MNPVQQNIQSQPAHWLVYTQDFNVAECMPIRVSLITEQTIDGTAMQVTRKFVIPAVTVRVLAQFCSDNNRFADGQPDVLGLLVESLLGKEENGVAVPGLIGTIEERYRDLPGVRTAEEETSRQKMLAARAEQAAARAAKRNVFKLETKIEPKV